MLEDTLKSQLQTYLGMLRNPIRLIATLDDSETGLEMRSLLETIVTLSDKVMLDTSGSDPRTPSFLVVREGETQGVRFAGLPLGHEFTSLVLALLWTGGHPPKVEQDVLDSIRALDGDFNFEVYMSLSCHNCPDVVQALSLMAIFNPKVKTVVIEGGAFQQEVSEREIMAVPMVFLNGKVFGSGRMLVEEIVAKIDTGSADREATKINAKENFDLLIVGGGPAGAAAAVYAARKGIRFKELVTGQEHHIALEGVFVQIGLIPKTEFLKDTLELSKFGEIVVDAKGHTNVPGVFAAGDCTTVPFKQIVIAAGDGAKAALSAFDHLIRTPVAA